MPHDFTSILECLECRGPLVCGERGMECRVGHHVYPVVNGAVVFTQGSPEEQIGEVGDPLIYTLKAYFKKYEKTYYVLVKIAGALFVGEKTGAKAFRHLPADAVILNLGSGPKTIGANVTNVDFLPFPGVQVAADVTKLPFRSGSVDAAICECLLEHVRKPEEVVREAARVLKPGGSVYVSIPFMDAYHSAPDDYYRWTTSGLRELMGAFEEQELRIAFGPTSAMISASANWLGVVLSFGSKTLYQLWTLFFMVILSPLKLLDYAFRHYPYATNSSVGYYYIGRKK